MNGSRGIWLALALCLLTLCVGITGRSAWTSDEPRVAAIALEMSRTGDVLVPHLAGEPFVEKPPLYFAAAAGLIRALGPTLGVVGAARLTSALCGLLTLLFVGLLARRLGGRELGLWSVVILGTTGVFVMESHWIRVDIALLLWSTAAIWSFGEAYVGARPKALLLAGGFTGLAFLTKGLIAGAVIAPAWLGLFLPWFLEHRRQPGPRDWRRHVLAHGGALVVLLGVVAAWVVPFRSAAGHELWNFWLYENQLGRFTGANRTLGHTYENLRPFYYLRPLLGDTLPWSPLVLVWLGRRFAADWRKGRFTRQDLLLTCWGFGTLALLTLSHTKRGLYLVPVLPSFAILSASVVQAGIRPWVGRTYRALVALGALMLLLQLLAPLAGTALEDGPWSAFLRSHVLLDYEPRHVLLGAALLLVLELLRRSRAGFGHLVAAVAVLLITMLTVNWPILNRVRSVEAEVQEFMARIPDDARARMAASSLGEVERGSIYLFTGLSFLQVDHGRASRILAGKDPQFESILYGRLPGQQEFGPTPYRVLQEANLAQRFDQRRDHHWVGWLAPATEEPDAPRPAPDAPDGLH